MQSTALRSAIRLTSRPIAASNASRHVLKRRFASEAPGGDVSKGDSTRSVPPQSSNKVIFVVGAGLIFAMVAGRYILASDKPAASGHAEQSAARRAGDTSNRDPRDSGVKTLEQKKQKQQQQQE